MEHDLFRTKRADGARIGLIWGMEMGKEEERVSSVDTRPAFQRLGFWR
jgi:hypothetical protein